MQSLVYAAYHNDDSVVAESSSGGIFTAISDYVIKNGGIIVGAKYNYQSHKLEHKVCRTYEERDMLRGSKYIQSTISKEVYFEIEKCLEEEQMCLFVGTPCQVGAIMQYLNVKNISKKNLLTCDIFCHGVGSPGIWEYYINWIQKKKKMGISFLTFKDKRNGWRKPICIATDGKKETSLRGYSWLYFSNNILRPSCHNCKYANCDRIGDVSIGDYWKIKEKHPEMYNKMGTSVLLVNTEKGIIVFDKMKNNLKYKESSIEKCMQNNLQKSTIPGKYRKKIMNDYRKKAKAFFVRWEISILISKIKGKIIKC